MKKTKILILFVLIISLSTLCGCWNYKEISDLYFVSGFAIDYVKETDRINLTVEVAVPKMSASGFELQSLVFQETGENCFDAIRNIIPKLGKKLNWSHSKVLILGTNVFEKEGALQDVIDFMDRTIETREDFWILASKEKTAGEIFTDTQTEIQDIKSFIINESLYNEQSLSKYEGVPAWEFLQELSSPSTSAALPAVQFDYVQENKVPVVLGEAIIKNKKLVGWLSGDEIKYKLFTTGDYKGGVYSINEVISGEPVKAAIELKSVNTKTTSKISKNKITMDVEIKIDAVMVEMNNNNIDITKQDERNQIVKIFKKNLQTETQNFINKIQKDYGSDIFGFGETISIQHYKDWKKLKSNWQEVYPNIKVNVKVDLKFLGSAIISNPRKVKG